MSLEYNQTNQKSNLYSGGGKRNSIGLLCDTIEEFNLDSKAECDQLHLAHETKTNKCQCRYIPL